MLDKAPLTSFREIREEWEALLSCCPVRSIFLTPIWQETWWNTFRDGEKLAGFYLRGSEGVTGIASLARSADDLVFVGNQDTFDYNDFMVKPGHEGEFFNAVIGTMEEQRCQGLKLFSLLDSSPTLDFLPRIARGRGYSVEIEKEDVTSGVALPSTWEEYVSTLSKKDRHELRRKFRRLDSLADWRSYCLDEPGEVMAGLDDFLRLMQESKKAKKEYLTPERERFFRRISGRLAEQRNARLFFLESEGQPVATSLCFDYESARLLYNSGYDPEYGYYSIGLLLNALCIKDAIENGVGYFDFLRGPEPYKQRLGGHTRDLYQMTVRRV